MDEHQYGPHSSGGNLVSDGTRTQLYAGEHGPIVVDPLLYTQAQVDALVGAAKEQAAKVPEDAAIRLMGGKKRVNLIDTHVSYVLTDIAKRIREGK